LVCGAAAGAFSVPRYDGRIVLSYLALLALLVVGTWRATRGSRPSQPPAGAGRLAFAVALAGAGVATVAVPAFSYVTGPSGDLLRQAGCVGALTAAALVALPWRHGSTAGLLVAACCYTATAAAALRLDPAPRIDVWYTLQGAADGLLTGQDLYRQVWVGPPGTMAAFTYLPWTAVLLAPGRWLLSDVRWSLIAVTLCTALALVRFPGRVREAGPATVAMATMSNRIPVAPAAAAALLLTLPGTLTQVEQAWTEPLLLALLVAATAALHRGRTGWAVVWLALALASKQHVALLLPVLAAWPRFGLRRAVTAAVLAGGLMLPWFVADPAAMWHDTVTLLVSFPPLRFADTAYIAVLNSWGVQPPFWLTGAVVLGVITGTAWLVRRYDPEPDVVLRWCAVTLMVANLVNKQAFYNQYWLVAGLVLAAWATSTVSEPGRRSGTDGPATAAGTARG
jgi:hypothetical protein